MTDITANVVVSMPSQLFTMARSFKAVANGKIYIGKIDTDPVNPENQIQVYVENEDGSHVPVSQPIIINAAGYPVYNGQIAKFVTVQGHSMAVYDAYGVQQFYFQNVLKYDPDQLRHLLQHENSGQLVDDSNVFIKQPLAGAIQRSQHSKNLDFVSIRDFGAIGDGTLHKLSEKFSSLSLARVVYPFATSLEQSIDGLAIQAALDTGKHIYLTEGVFICDLELELLTHGQRIIGSGRGYGYQALNQYSENGSIVPHYIGPVFNWVDCSTLMFVGTGTKRIRTRRKYRSGSGDAQDEAISVNINIQAEGVQLEHFAVRTKVYPPESGPDGEYTDSIDNLGADWDVGIFNGCRCNTQLIDIAVIGYHRKANIWFDVTQPSGAGRFKSYRTGNSYPRGIWGDGSDGCILDRVFTSGGLWGVNVFGASPAPGHDSYAPEGYENYYDPVENKLIPDDRGAGGFSDFVIINSQIFGANHHTKRRLVDMKTSPDPLTDWDVGGAFNIDGLGGNVSKAIHGHRYIGTRFQSDAPFCVRIDRSARDTFLGCMIENPFKVRMRDGTPITSNQTSNTFFGLCATTNHRLMEIIESHAPFALTYTTLRYGDTMLFNSADSRSNTKLPFGDLRILSESTQQESQILLGSIDNPNYARIKRAPAGSILAQTDASFQVQSISGNTKFMVTSDGNAVSGKHIYPTDDSGGNCGIPEKRWNQVYASTGSINTSDERAKIEKEEIPEEILKAWGKVNFMQYKFTDAVKEKGDKARIHFGVIAQRVKEAFESEGIDPFAYGILCYDEWDDSYEPVFSSKIEVNEFGEQIEKIYETGELRLKNKAGNRYGIRYDEALVLECAYLRWCINNIKKI